MRPQFDRDGFAEAVSAWLEREGLSYREACARHDLLNPAMLSRALHCQVLSVESLLAVCAACGLDPMGFTNFQQLEQAVTATDKRETRAGAA